VETCHRINTKFCQTLEVRDMTFAGKTVDAFIAPYKTYFRWLPQNSVLLYKPNPPDIFLFVWE
jgi:hypothetical protein